MSGPAAAQADDAAAAEADDAAAAQADDSWPGRVEEWTPRTGLLFLMVDSSMRSLRVFSSS